MLGKFAIRALIAFTVYVGAKELPCNFHQSVNISGGIEFPNGSIFHEGHEYSIENYGIVQEIILPDYSIKSVKEHIRGCYCLLKSAKPCVPFCCPPGFIRKGDHSSDCKPSNHEVFLKANNTEKGKNIRVKDEFTIIYKEQCEAYLLEDDMESSEHWKLLSVNIQ